MADSTSTTEESSYTKMDSTDLEAIGARCQYAYCHQLDFLPFRCESCKSSFCLDHRSETAHKCSRAGEWAKSRRKNSFSSKANNHGSSGLSLSSGGPTLNGLNPTQCSKAQCKTIINTIQNTGSRCDQCNRQYCLKHRFREEHDCETIAALGARQSRNNSNNKNNRQLETQAEKLRLGFSRLRSWGKDKQESLRPKFNSPSAVAASNNRASQLAALNTLKRNAKGDPSLAVEKRVYFHVEAEATSTTSKLAQADLYFSSDWSVGRVLDEAAKRMQVANVNNRVEGEEQRLRLYHVRGGRLLAFGDKIVAKKNDDGDDVKSGDTLVLLRGVEPGS